MKNTTRMEEALWKAYAERLLTDIETSVFLSPECFPDGTHNIRMYNRWADSEVMVSLLDGVIHREDGPAVFLKGTKRFLWVLDGKLTDMETVLDTPEKREAYLLEESLRRL